MKYAIVPVTPFQQNCSLLWCEQSREGVVVDPGGDLERIEAVAERHGVALRCILVTHGHVDHAGSVAELARRHALPVEGPHSEDRFWIEAMANQSGMYGLPPAEPFTPQRWLADGDTVRFGQVELSVLHCPGHTPGHVVFFDPASRIAIVGDVLFQGSIGRTDFPRSDYRALLQSIREKLLPLGDEVLFIPGHGPMSTLGEERRHNPFLGQPLPRF